MAVRTFRFPLPGRREPVSTVPGPRPATTLSGALDASVRQLRQRLRWQAGFGPAAFAAPGVIQAKFAGKYGAVLSALSPQHLGIGDNFYGALWNDLGQSPVDVAVEAGAPKYDQASRTLYLNESVLVDLLGKKAPNDKVKASWVAHITHELSHAHDHVIKQRNIRTPVLGGREGHTKDVIETELRAWAREALSAHQISPKDLDDEKARLVAGWKNYAEAQLDDIAAAAQGNEVMDRLKRYAERELARKVNSNDPEIEVQDWVDGHKPWLAGELLRHQNSLAPRW